MYASELFCGECGWRGELTHRYSCPLCGYSLEVGYAYDKIPKAVFEESIFLGRGLWDYSALLPVREEKNIVSMQEGNTPLLDSMLLGRRLGIELFFKDETRNPTCSFKDRPNTVGISVAKELGADAVCIASTGNGAASLAAYAARAGMKCYVFVPEATPGGKILQAIAHGAQLVRVPGDYSNAFAACYEASGREGWANLTSTYINPYTMEGDKSIGYELYRQMDRKIADWIVVPLGAGAMLSGIYKAYCELMRFGLAEKLPKMLGVQARNCSPIIQAYERGLDEVGPVHTLPTAAGAIADALTGYERDGTRTLRSMRASKGAGVAVEEAEIEKWALELAREEGLFLEPASVTAIAAVERMVKSGQIGRGESVVCIMTAHGLKEPEFYETAL